MEEYDRIYIKLCETFDDHHVNGYGSTRLKLKQKKKEEELLNEFYETVISKINKRYENVKVLERNDEIGKKLYKGARKGYVFTTRDGETGYFVDNESKNVKWKISKRNLKKHKLCNVYTKECDDNWWKDEYKSKHPRKSPFMYLFLVVVFGLFVSMYFEDIVNLYYQLQPQYKEYYYNLYDRLLEQEFYKNLVLTSHNFSKNLQLLEKYIIDKLLTHNYDDYKNLTLWN